MIRPSHSSRAATPASPPNYLGKFRGTVTQNFDPNGIGRLIVTVPDVSKQPLLSWALPCTPVGGLQNGLFAVPPIGTGVWVEFEQGDIDYPIWTGCFWGSGSEVPNRSKSVHKPLLQSITLQTPTQHSITISDIPNNGIEIKTPLGAKIQVTDISIKLDNGKGASIEMMGPRITIKAAQVDINNGALQIM